MLVYIVCEKTEDEDKKILKAFTDRERAEDFMIKTAAEEFEALEIPANERECYADNKGNLWSIIDIHQVSYGCFFEEGEAVSIFLEVAELDTGEDNEIEVTVYGDTTGLYTEAEISDWPLYELKFPKEIVRGYWEDIACHKYHDYGENITFEDWLRNYCTADDTEYLCDYAIGHGFTPTRED